jgi:hypothetical protein
VAGSDHTDADRPADRRGQFLRTDPACERVLAAREATFALFFRDAPAIAERNQVPWPAELEHAVRAYLDRQGCPLPAPAPARLAG